ncbi:hypothetical protein ACFL43_01740 [Thermodesulfobacteriota bacterium]
MAYTPQLNERSSDTLRRIAWALGVPMTKAIERVMEDSVHNIDRSKVCTCCKDPTKCDSCAFWDSKNIAPGIRLNDLIKKTDSNLL